MTKEVGLNFVHGAFANEIHADQPLMLSGGLCWIDFNNDGWQDLYLVNSHTEQEIEFWKENGGLPRNQLYQNNKGKFICVEQIIRGIEGALAKNKVQLPIDRKSYFFRHYMATYWAYTKKHKENAIDLARDLGDKDINFVAENYIKPFKNNGNAAENIDYQNQHFNWK